MGTSRSGEHLASKLFHAADGINGAKKDGLAKAALLVKTSVVAAMGGVTRLRGVGRKGARIGVRYDAKSDSATVRATGPFHLLERDTAAHPIGPKRGKALHLANGNIVARVAEHPGTHGKHPFERGVEAATPLVPKVMAEEQVRSLGRFFR